MAGVEHGLDFRLAVFLLARHHVAAREHQVIDNRVRLGPLLKQVVALEERVVPETGVSDDQSLHRHRVLVHQIGDAGVRVDHDFVGERLITLAVGLLVADELLPVAPMRVADRKSDAGIGDEHLLGADDLDLVGIGVESVSGGALSDGPLVALDQTEIPFRADRDEAHGVNSLACALNNSRKTG